MTATQFPIIDGHNDMLMYFRPPGEHALSTFFERRAGSQLDLPRAREGGFAGGFFAIFVPEESAMSMLDDFDPDTEYELPQLDSTTAQRMTMAMAANLFRLEALSGGKLKIVRTASDMETCLRDGVIGAILHFEGAEAIDTDLNALDVYYQAGLRSLGIVWSRPTAFGYGVPFKFPHSPDTGPGLTEEGMALVRACNELGILIDLSHLNEQGFWDVAKISDAPLVATHSNAHALCQLPRNLTDKQLDAIREHDGIVGLNFVVMLLREDARDDTDTPLETMIRHIDYLAERVGIERVGLGSDFGVASVPAAIGDASGLPKLIDALRQAGYDDDALRKITHENWLRILRKTWKSE